MGFFKDKLIHYIMDCVWVIAIKVLTEFLAFITFVLWEKSWGKALGVSVWCLFSARLEWRSLMKITFCGIINKSTFNVYFFIFSVSIYEHYWVLVSLFINAYLIYRDYNFLSQGHASYSLYHSCKVSHDPELYWKALIRQKCAKYACMLACLWRLELHVFLEYWVSPALTYLLEIKLLMKIPSVVKLTCKSIVKSDSIIDAFKINVFF